MITCQHARQLFDRHLDDELSPSLQAELHAHVIQCTPCQNQLAVFEACGDVIRLDAREPRASSSFADRVMAGRRQQLAAKPAERTVGGRRILWRIGVPMAAAASIVLALMLFALAPKHDAGHKTVVAGPGGVVAAPKEVRKNLTEMFGTPQRDAKSEEELAHTPEMKALPFLEAVVEGTQNAAAGTRQSYDDIRTLVRILFDGANDRLAAEYREKHPEVPQQTVISDLDILQKVLAPAPESPGPEVAPSNPAPSKAVASPDPL